MTKKPKMTKPEPFRFGSMTKAELIRTVKTLDKRQTKLLNEVARLKTELDASKTDWFAAYRASSTGPQRDRLPWERE